MPSLSNQLAKLSEKVDNAKDWLRDVARDYRKDHDEVVKLRKDVDTIRKRLEKFDRLFAALVIGIATSVIGGIFAIIVAAMKLLSSGEAPHV